MTDKDFYYPRKPEALLNATRGWGWELSAFYSILLDLIYHFEGAIPDDLDMVRTWVGLDLRPMQWARFRDALIERGKLYRTAQGTLRNPVADKWFAKRSTEKNENTGAKPSENGSKKDENASRFAGGNADQSDHKKTKQNNEDPPQLPLDAAPVPARARNSQSYSKSQTSASASAGDMAEVVQATSELSDILGIPKGRYWEADYRRLIGAGLSKEAIFEAARAWQGDPLRGLNGLKVKAERMQQDLDWKAKADHPGGVLGTTITSASHSDREWETHLGGLLRIGAWMASTHGICPTRPGHVVPPGPYGKWKALWDAQGGHPLREGDLSGNIVPYPAERPGPMLRAIWEPSA